MFSGIRRLFRFAAPMQENLTKEPAENGTIDQLLNSSHEELNQQVMETRLRLEQEQERKQDTIGLVSGLAITACFITFAIREKIRNVENNTDDPIDLSPANHLNFLLRG